MFKHDLRLEQVYSFSRLDENNPLSTVSPHGFQLEDRYWPTVEHYYQSNKFAKPVIVQEILDAENGVAAYKLGNRWWKFGRHKDWKQKRRVRMTRALYTKVQVHQEVKNALMDTGDERIVETSLYDPYWGIGRDQRGENMLGQIWMDIRAKLRADQKIKDNQRQV
ncbi:NADAR family protein [Halioxenophilus sp. WMMB6]|uniref:NADAR family protein n=1 Tax=Halioxenophilus sp. WMMB6 TaxID=3073815 RepID=UPI00295EDBC7|nr:NADAR family protein [Halioxenophilus sp. WMMB6]